MNELSTFDRYRWALDVHDWWEPKHRPPTEVMAQIATEAIIYYYHQDNDLILDIPQRILTGRLYERVPSL